MPSYDQTVSITNNIGNGAYVAFIEIDGSVVKNVLGQPIGTLQGPADINNATSFTINAYVDPTRKRFFVSFPAGQGLEQTLGFSPPASAS